MLKAIKTLGNTFFVVHGLVCLGSTAMYLSWLGSRRSSARYLATLTQGKFGRLKINLVFAEKDVKLKKERENGADSYGYKGGREQSRS